MKLRDIDLSGLRIIRYPDPRLRQPAQPVTEWGEALRPLVTRMFQIMYAARGVGLAAPQLGLPLRLFVCNPNGQPGAGEVVYANPQLISQEGELNEEEGCLSFPGASARIRRYSKAILAAMDIDGKPVQQTGEGMMARVFQHETDHVNGVLILDRMPAMAKLANHSAIQNLEKAYAGIE